MDDMQTVKVETPHGTLHTAISKPSDPSSASNPTILFIHGNSSSSQIFEPLLVNPTLKAKYPLLIFDLPGHGQSSNAPEPEKSYTQSAYGDAALHVLRHHGVKEVIVLGWSLGGHSAIEMLPLLPGPANSTGIRCLGIMVVGVPPIAGPTQVGEGFQGDISGGPPSIADLPDEVKSMFASVMTRMKPAPEWLDQAVKRTDGRSREIMFKAFTSGGGSDQVKVVQEWEDGWVAIVNGKNEPFIKLDYCATVAKGVKKLWEGKAIEVEGCEHAPFFEEPEAFTPMFLRFVEDCSKLRKA